MLYTMSLSGLNFDNIIPQHVSLAEYGFKPGTCRVDDAKENILDCDESQDENLLLASFKPGTSHIFGYGVEIIRNGKDEKLMRFRDEDSWMAFETAQNTNLIVSFVGNLEVSREEFVLMNTQDIAEAAKRCRFIVTDAIAHTA